MVVKNPGSKELHHYLAIKPNNPLKKKITHSYVENSQEYQFFKKRITSNSQKIPVTIYKEQTAVKLQFNLQIYDQIHSCT